MKSIGKVAALLILAMLLMPFCPMSVSVAGPVASAHNCHGEQAPSGKIMRSCCDDGGIPVPAFQPQSLAVIGSIALVAEPAACAPEAAPVLEQESSPPDTGARLAELSLLRI